MSLVRARLNGVDHTMSRFFARRLKAQIIQSPVTNADGTLRGSTSADSGRKAKPKTTVDEASAVKKAAPKPATNTEENES